MTNWLQDVELSFKEMVCIKPYGEDFEVGKIYTVEWSEIWKAYEVSIDEWNSAIMSKEKLFEYFDYKKEM